MILSVVRLGWILGVIVATGVPASAQSTAPDPKPPVRFVWNDYPSIRAGALRVDVHTKWQADFRGSEQDLSAAGHLYQTGLRRLGVDGRLTRRINFQIEGELRKNNPWRNVYVNVALSPALEVRAGKMKMPFSYEELTGATTLDFVFRTQLARIIAPARDVGVMAHGQVLGRIVGYQAGWFRHDGENASVREPAINHSIAGRISIAPLRYASVPRELRQLHIGLAATAARLPEGLHSLRGRSLFGSTFLEPVYVRGRRRRIGAEIAWLPGPFSIKSEYARSTDDRHRQGLADEDISDFVASAWYVSGTWLLTGERKTAGIEPRRPLLQKGFGAIEVGARYDTIAFGSARNEGTAFDNPRADPLLGNAERTWTAGVTWYLNKWGKVLANGIREAFDDGHRTAIPGRKSGWSGVLRLQLVM